MEKNTNAIVFVQALEYAIKDRPQLIKDFLKEEHLEDKFMKFQKENKYIMDDNRGKTLFCEAIALLKEIAESRGQFYSEEEHADYFKRVEDVIKGAEEMEPKK